jgi:hypothetical protein
LTLKKTGKDFEGNVRGIKEVLYWYLKGGTEENHPKV